MTNPMERVKKPNLILNIYGQEAWHTEARIIGSKAALRALGKAIDKAIKTGVTTLPLPFSDNPLFASDGEGYLLGIYCFDGWDDKRWEAYQPDYRILEK